MYIYYVYTCMHICVYIYTYIYSAAFFPQKGMLEAMLAKANKTPTELFFISWRACVRACVCA